MSSQSRRDFLLASSGAVALAAMTPGRISAEPLQTADLGLPLASAFAGGHEIKALPFDPGKLDGISEKLIRSHWENNYAGSVKALNTIKQKLAGFLNDADLPAFVYNDLKREHLMRTGSVV
ncbi:MAG: superoxide dismutase, partial [Methylococcales bacterium]